MEEIIEAITRAEERALNIREEALKKAEQIAAKAADEAELISKRSESEIRLYRERSLKQAEAEGEKRYAEALAKTRAAAKAYADGVIKKADGVAADVVGRITSGSR